MRDEHAEIPTPAPAAKADGAEGSEDEAESPRAAVLCRGDRVDVGAAASEDEGEENTVTSTTTQPAAADPWTPIFSTGNHLGIEWTRADLAALVRNFEIFRGKIIPPIGVGHDEPPILPGFNKSAQPQLGHVSALRVNGDRLEAQLSQLPGYLLQLLRAGRYTRVSSEIVPDISRSSIARNIGPAAALARGPTLVGLALCGAMRPECADLPSLAEIYATEGVASGTDEDDGIMRFDFTAAELRADAAPEANAADDGEATRAPLSLAERLTLADKRLAFMANNRKAAEVILDTYALEREKMQFTSFAPEVADEVGGLAHTFLAEVEATLQKNKWNRDDVEARRRAARQVLTEWRMKPAPAGSDADSLADEVRSEDFEAAITGYSPTNSGLPRERGVVQASEKGRRPRDEAPELAPEFYGSAGLEMQRLGSAARYHRLRSIAKARGLNLQRFSERTQAEAELTREEGFTVKEATTFDEALAALNFGETTAGDPARAARELIRQRPDLRPMYGERARPPVAEDARAICFREAAAEELRGISWDDPNRVGLAYRRAAVRQGMLCPDYGSIARKRGWVPR